MKWDPFLDYSDVLETSASGRMQVVHSHYSNVSGYSRDLLEKKIHFRQIEDLSDQKSNNQRSRRGRHRTVSPSPRSQPSGQQRGDKQSDSTQGDSMAYYTYFSSCAKMPYSPRIMDKKQQEKLTANETQKASSIFGMHKFQSV